MFLEIFRVERANHTAINKKIKQKIQVSLTKEKNNVNIQSRLLFFSFEKREILKGVFSMRKSGMLILVLVFSVFFGIQTIHAKELTWTGTQTLTSLGAEIPLSGKNFFRTSIHYFWTPEIGHEKDMVAVYTGPKMRSENMWVAPQIGFMGNWMEEGKDALILSVWSGGSWGKFSAFLEVEVYLAQNNPVDFYGCYFFNYDPMATLNVGWHVEEVNLKFSTGPHIGITKGPIHFELQYYINPDLNHTVRIVTGVGF